MYTDEKVTKFVKAKDLDSLRDMYESGELKHGEYMRAVSRAKQTRAVNLTNIDYQQTLNTLYTVYNRILLFVVIDLVLTYLLKFVVLKGSLQLIVVLYLLVIYVPACIYIWKLKAFKLKQLEYPTPEIKRNTLAFKRLLVLQFIPLVSIIADFILLYYGLSCKLHLKNMYKNDKLKM